MYLYILSIWYYIIEHNYTYGLLKFNIFPILDVTASILYLNYIEKRRRMTSEVTGDQNKYENLLSCGG